MGRGSWEMPWDDPRAGRPHGHGHPGFGGPPWGAGPPPWLQNLIGGLAGSGRGPRGPKARRGDVRAAILDVLAVEPMNGYQIIQQIAERTGGAWKPSPGSVYPTVQQLEDEGLVAGDEAQGRRLLGLTEAGRRYVDEHPEELAGTWRAFEAEPEPEEHGDLKAVIGQVMAAVWQLVVSGTRQQRAEATEILADTRRRLYGLLAEGDPEQS
jgi:DNA-binding PadR family transcriptional regulator